MQTGYEKSNNNNNNDINHSGRTRNTSVDADRYAELVNDLDLISRFCMPICCRDSETRELALDVISKTVEGWLDGVGSPRHYRLGLGPPEALLRGSRLLPVSVTGNACVCVNSSATDAMANGPVLSDPGASNSVPKEYMDLVTLHLPILLRLSMSCPFINVREKCHHILDVVKNRGLSIPYPTTHGPSAYIDPEELPHLGTDNDKTHTLFIDAFLQNNRLDHVSQVMGYHPTYLDHFLKTQSFIMRGDGPLPYDYRHFIAIIAAGRHQCSYLITLQKQEFLLQGGDPTWLKGLSCIPKKLRNLYDINKILAHRPWLINKSHIEKLTKGNDSWSLAEVVHAIVILAHFHSLSSFVFSCGVNQEVDQSGGHAYHPQCCGAGVDTPGLLDAATIINGSATDIAGAGGMPGVRDVVDGASMSTLPKDIPRLNDTRQIINISPSTNSSSSSPTEPEVGITTLMQRMKTLSERTEQCTPIELTKRFEHVESQSAELGAVPDQPPEISADIGHFVEDPTFLYQDFARRGEAEIPTFRVQDYSWDDHGYSLVNRLYNDVGNLLDEKFKTAYNLTYYTMGGRTDVDTSRFRRAIWNYIQCMFGIRHDDYDYGEVNQLLERSLKTFIKSACCYPERVTKKDYDRVLREFKHSEKVHVNLMVLEARMQAELLYALRAVMRYMT